MSPQPPTPEQVIATTLEGRIHLRGPIIVMDVPTVAKEVVEALRKGRRTAIQAQAAANSAANAAISQGRATVAMDRVPPAPIPVLPTVTSIVSPTANQSDADDAIGFADDILSMIDELPDRAYDFGESIREKVEGIKQTIEERQCVTHGQWEALDNMKGGVERWLDH